MDGAGRGERRTGESGVYFTEEFSHGRGFGDGVTRRAIRFRGRRRDMVG